MTSRLTAFATRVRVVDWAFAAVALVLTIFALWPPAFGPGLLPPYIELLNYGYSAVLFTIFVVVLSVRGVLNLSQGFVLAPLVLSLIGVASLVHVWVVDPAITTYSSALIPLLICALPALVAAEDVVINFNAMLSFIIFLFFTVSVSHLFWQLAQTAGLPVEVGHEQTFLFCFVLLLAGFMRRKALVVVTLAMIAVSLALRPTSSLLVCVILSLGTTFIYRIGFRRSLRVTMYVFIALLLVGNLVVMLSPDFANAIYSLEPYFKQSVLEAHSNNEFRLGIIEALRSETASGSIVFGKYFSGSVLPYVTNIIPWWYHESGSDYAPVHSDFLIMYSQGGLAGYALFAILFLGFARLCIRGAQLSTLLRNEDAASFFDAVLIIEVVFTVYISFNPMMQKPYMVGLFFFLMPVCVFLFRDQERTMLAIGAGADTDYFKAVPRSSFQPMIGRTFT